MTAYAPVTAPPPSRTGNPFGVASILLAAAILLIGVVTRILSYAAPLLQRGTGSSVATISAIFAVTGVIGLLLGIAAAVLGLIGVTRAGRPHALAGAGAAVGLFEVGSWVVSVVGDPIVGALVTHG